VADSSGARKSKDPVVYALSRPSRCYGCDIRLQSGEIVKLEKDSEDKEVFCRKCAGLEALELLPGGNAKITRLAKKYSSVRYVVVRWSDLWKSYERQGLLVESQAIDRAEEESGTRLLKRENQAKQ